MNTFNLKQAAEFMKMSPEGLRRLAVNGRLPAAKIGKCWLFIETDLVEHMRSSYAKPAETSWGVLERNRRTTWHSTKEVKSGGLLSVTVDKEYKKLLEQKIKKQRNNSMTR